MPKLDLTPNQTAQLNDWLYGGPTDPTGLIPWLAANALTAKPEVVYQAEGERDFYLLLIAKNGGQIKRQDITTKMADAFAWVADSLDQWEALGVPIEEHQQQMRPLWAFMRSLV